MLYFPSKSGLYRDPEGGGDQKRERKCHAEKDADNFFMWWKAFLCPGREALFEQFPYKGSSTF